MKAGLLAAVLAFSAYAGAQERTWTSVGVPNAVCGNGDPYRIFISSGDNDKVAFAFQGGGACWSEDSCYGWIQTADLKGRNTVNEQGGIFSKDPKRSPLAKHSMIYFPYCTGDVFAGRHDTVYGKKPTKHQGATNVESAFDLLLRDYPKMFQAIDHLAVYGYSAGAIGAIVHIREIEKLFGGGVPNKRAVFDAPGLHWGDSFWHKFTPDLNKDYEFALTRAGLSWNRDTGLVADIIPATCRDLSDWNIGVLQSTRDRIMSLVFGDTTPGDHEARVLGKNGILDLTANPFDNCMAFVPAATNHTMLPEDKKSPPMAGGWLPMQFATQVYAGHQFASLK